MGGGKGGGKGGGGSSVNVQPSPYEIAMAQIAQEVFGQTRPLRNYFLEDWTSFLRPQYTQPYMPLTTPVTGGNVFTNPRYPYGVEYGGGTGSSSEAGSVAGLPGYTAPGVMPTSNAANAWPVSPAFDAGTQKPTSEYPPSNWAAAWQLAGNQPILPHGMSYSTSPGGNAASIASPVGYIGRDFGQPLYEYGGRYFDHSGQEWFGDQGNVWWSQGYSPGGQGGGGRGGGQIQEGPIYRSERRYDPYNIPGYQPLYQLARQGIESQFSQARQGVLGSLPRGGGLNDALTNLEINRAVQAGSLPAQIASPLIQDIMSKAYGAAWNAPQQSMAGLGGAATSYAGRYGSALASQTAAANRGMTGAAGLGQLAGLGLGSMGGKGAKDAGLTAMLPLVGV